MTPGLALFYGGMVRSKNVLSMLMKNFITIGIVSVVWSVVGFTIAFGTDVGSMLGGFDFIGLNGVEGDFMLFMVFQMMFAIITPALISGAVAERMKFSAWVLFTTLWALIVYPIVAHWAFAADGWMYEWGSVTSPAASWSTSTPGSPPSPWCSPSGHARGSAPRRCGRTRCR